MPAPDADPGEIRTQVKPADNAASRLQGSRVASGHKKSRNPDDLPAFRVIEI